jgi:hypothetical protein
MLPLYELDEGSEILLALATQKSIVYKINSTIESILGPGTIHVQSDLFVDSFGTAVARVPWGRRGSMSQRHLASNRRDDPGMRVSEPLLDGKRTGVRLWQQTPLQPLAQSRLNYQVLGSTLVVTCRTLTQTESRNFRYRSIAILFACIILVNTLLMLWDSHRGSVYVGFPIMLFFVAYLLTAFFRIWCKHT